MLKSYISQLKKTDYYEKWDVKKKRRLFPYVHITYSNLWLIVQWGLIKFSLCCYLPFYIPKPFHLCIFCLLLIHIFYNSDIFFSGLFCTFDGILFYICLYIHKSKIKLYENKYLYRRFIEKRLWADSNI